jgi:hypothetical protein
MKNKGALFLSVVLWLCGTLGWSLIYKVVCEIPAGIQKNQIYYMKMENRYLQPRGIAFDGKRFYIGDIYKKRIFICDTQGKYIDEIVNPAFSEIESLKFWKGKLWVKIFRNYFETMNIWKIDPSNKKVLLKIEPWENGFAKKIVDYQFKDNSLWMIAEDESCFKLDTQTGKVKEFVPSPWFDKDGYYRLIKKGDIYTLLFWDKNKKFRKRVILPKNKFYRLVDDGKTIWVDPLVYKKRSVFLYHYDITGKIVKKANRATVLSKIADNPFIFTLIERGRPKVRIIQIK